MEANEKSWTVQKDAFLTETTNKESVRVKNRSSEESKMPVVLIKERWMGQLSLNDKFGLKLAVSNFAEERDALTTVKRVFWTLDRERGRETATGHWLST